jgi:hypothetical protein
VNAAEDPAPDLAADGESVRIPGRPEGTSAVGGPEGPVGVGESASLLRALPKEMGVILFSAGVIGFVLPGPGTPALIAGGLILWPDRFEKVEGWLQRRFPGLHREGVGHVERFLSDLEKRYPGSIR